ncbi:MAG TPA: F0F1 ATP synthase subunit B [Stellaceae bacterium]|jgi:F-type H+-transporting ATPase subunit b|nr:F0F1 ATP synthase subunit B [Stellaceae bacterium]
MAHLTGLLREGEFWVLVAFVIAISFLVYKARVAALAALDQRAAKIKSGLDEAQRLAEEAQKSLAQYQLKQRDALKESEAIVEQARAEAARFLAQARSDLAAALERRRRMAIERIALDEAKAVTEVRNQAIEVAVAAVRRILARDLDAANRATLIDRAIAALPETLH